MGKAEMHPSKVYLPQHDAPSITSSRLAAGAEQYSRGGARVIPGEERQRPVQHRIISGMAAAALTRVAQCTALFLRVMERAVCVCVCVLVSVFV